MMYEDPSQRNSLLEQYSVDYIVIGSQELASYAIPDYDDMLRTYPVAYKKDGIVVLTVT